MGSKKKIEVIARGLLVHQGRILLCRNIKGKYTYLPGGHVEFGERASVALEREFLEETGLSAKAGPMLLATEQHFDEAKGSHHEINIVFLVEQLGPAPTPPEQVASIEEKLAFDWVELAAIPETDLRPSEIKAWLISGGIVDKNSGPWLSGFDA